MSKGRWPFRQRDVTLAIKAAEKAGKAVTAVTVTSDGVRISLGDAPESAEDAVAAWDNAIPIGGERCYQERSRPVGKHRTAT